MNSLPYEHLGPYRLLSRLGAGGMGEVYLARDTRLGREVALKILPPDASGDPERRARLEREARFVSRLNHPRICQIYDIGHDSGADYFVMEYLRGETLAARLERGALPLNELLEVALQVCEALEVAHRTGLVHRDLKPANIALTEGGAKLLDFGISRLATVPEPADPGAREEMDRDPGVGDLTRTGVVVGSVPYIAPEQIEGHEADARSDVFSFGATLFEMATARRAFGGADRSTCIEAILHRRVPAVSSLRPRTPPGLDALVARCLEKDPAARWQDAGAVRAELSRIAEEDRERALGPARRRRLLVRAFVAASLLALAAFGLQRAGVALRPAPETMHALIGAPDSVRFLLSGDNGGPQALSPDGTRLAFVAVDAEGRQDVWLRPLAEQSSRRIEGTRNARFPFWSPDGRSIAFFTSDRLVRVDLASGRRTELCTAWSGRGGSWGSRGSIVFAATFRSGISVVPATGGTPREIVPRDSLHYTTYRWPHFLPDGRRFVYFAARHVNERPPPGVVVTLPEVRGGVFVASLDDPRPRLVRPTPGEAFVAGGHLLFGERGRLMAQRLDLASLRLEGTAFDAGERAYMDTSTWKLNASVSATGTLAVDEIGPSTGYEVAWLDRAGKVSGRTGTRGDHVNVRLSPDEGRLLVETREGNASWLWDWDLARNTGRRLDTAPECVMPMWMPGGRRFAYARMQEPGLALGIRVDTLASGGGVFLHSVLDNVWPEDATADGRYLLCGSGGYSVDRPGRLTLIPLFATPDDPRPWNARDALIVPVPVRFDRARISPDGRWLAYTLRASGLDEVWLSPFRPERFPRTWKALPRRLVSPHGGSRPRWRADGRELYYVRGHSSLVAVEVTRTADSLAFGPERELFRLPQRDSRNSYDVSRDGQRFVVVTLGHEDEARIAVVSNWLPTLARPR